MTWSRDHSPQTILTKHKEEINLCCVKPLRFSGVVYNKITQPNLTDKCRICHTVKVTNFLGNLKISSFLYLRGNQVKMSRGIWILHIGNLVSLYRLLLKMYILMNHPRKVYDLDFTVILV